MEFLLPLLRQQGMSSGERRRDRGPLQYRHRPRLSNTDQPDRGAKNIKYSVSVALTLFCVEWTTDWLGVNHALL